MTIHQFHQMNEMDKVSAIMQYGRLMAQNTEEDKRIFIYHLESFYVSACYLKNNDQLTEINCYLEVDQLIPHYRKHVIFIDPSQREYSTPEA
jgi:hypothetical protein